MPISLLAPIARPSWRTSRTKQPNARYWPLRRPHRNRAATGDMYGKWSAQVSVQHRIVLHFILQSLALITFIGICIVLADGLVHLLHGQTRTLTAEGRRPCEAFSSYDSGARPGDDPVGVFGTPKETPTILGLATAALTIALQDFIIAFLGWFVLIGKNGIHAGDWVEINGVGGEVTEVICSPRLCWRPELSPIKGLPTGRRITFMNGFAIRGQYFNFSTTGQWMWDEISLTFARPTISTNGREHSKVVVARRQRKMRRWQSRSGSADRTA